MTFYSTCKIGAGFLSQVVLRGGMEKTYEAPSNEAPFIPLGYHKGRLVTYLEQRPSLFRIPNPTGHWCCHKVSFGLGDLRYTGPDLLLLPLLPSVAGWSMGLKCVVFSRIFHGIRSLEQGVSNTAAGLEQVSNTAEALEDGSQARTGRLEHSRDWLSRTKVLGGSQTTPRSRGSSQTKEGLKRRGGSWTRGRLERLHNSLCKPKPVGLYACFAVWMLFLDVLCFFAVEPSYPTL